MPITKKEVEGFLKELHKLSHKEKLALRDFDKRIHTLYDHKKAIQRLIGHLDDLKRSYNVSSRRKIIDEIHFIKHEIISEFAVIIEGEVKDRDLELSLVKKEQIKYREKPDIVIEELEILAEHVSKDAERAIEGAIQLFDKKWKGSLQKTVKDVVKNMNKIMKTQSRLLLQEINALSALEREIKNGKVLSAQKLSREGEKMHDLVDKLMHVLHLEKDLVRDPFNKFLKEKSTSGRKAKIRGKQWKITLDDISRDIETFTEPFELRIYLSTLSKFNKKLAKEARGIHALTKHLETVLTEHKKKRKTLQKKLGKSI